ncbi:MAG: transposase, partial [Bacillota bacterium]|nr:transposase [Bacillota bacterium]
AVSSEENLDGKLFVQFVALIYLAYIDMAMRDKGLYRDYTLQELLDELDIIERFEQPGKQSHLGEMTKKQLELYRLLGVEPPA